MIGLEVVTYSVPQPLWWVYQDYSTWVCIMSSLSDTHLYYTADSERMRGVVGERATEVCF